MKEVRYFYVPNAAGREQLPEGEAAHALRVLRLTEGDAMVLMDGEGTFFEATVTAADKRHCLYRIERTLPQQPAWKGKLHLAIAPTKMMERMEWLAEKATEVGFNKLSFLDCRFSERKQIKVSRIEGIVVAAMKQSRKAWLPTVGELTPFRQFIDAHPSGRRFIAHCYEEVARTALFDELRKLPQSNEETIVLVGPEGDFSIDEVRYAMSRGFVSVHLGSSRLRTETAGLMAVTMMQLAQSYP